VHGGSRVANAVREILEGLGLAVLDDLETLFRKVRHDVALAVGDGDGKGGEIDAGSELLVYPPEGGHSRIDNESNQNHRDQPTTGSHRPILAGAII